MTLESVEQFAARFNKSKQTGYVWKAKEKLVMQGNLVDVEASLAKMALNHKGGASAQEGSSQTSQPRNKKSKPVIDRQIDSAVDSDELTVLPGETAEDAAKRLAPEVDESMSFDDARRVKEIYLALLNRLTYEEKSSALVDINLAETILFEKFRGVRDAWLNWPTRFAPLIAADLGIEQADKVTEVLTEYVHKQLSELGEPEADFTAE